MPYSRAPIAEAVVDLRAAFEKAPALAEVKAFAEGLRTQFPLIQDINSFAVNFAAEVGGGVETSATSEQLGYRLSSERNDRILQLGARGFAYSHMPPYSDWERFKGEIAPLWEHFAASFGVNSVTRIALRYINRIAVPVGYEVEDYVNIGPRIPDRISKLLIGYFTQMVLPVPELGSECRVIINTGVEPAANPEKPGLLLDIDLFGERSYGLEEVWQVLERFRDRKNLIFEASITDKVREMIR